MKLEIAAREAVIMQEALDWLYKECEEVITYDKNPETFGKAYYKMRIIEDLQGEIIYKLKSN
jgi:transposase-like protein